LNAVPPNQQSKIVNHQSKSFLHKTQSAGRAAQGCVETLSSLTIGNSALLKRDPATGPTTISQNQ
jgi:hypothetical protein